MTSKYEKMLLKAGLQRLSLNEVAPTDIYPYVRALQEYANGDPGEGPWYGYVPLEGGAYGTLFMDENEHVWRGPGKMPLSSDYTQVNLEGVVH